MHIRLSVLRLRVWVWTPTFLCGLCMRGFPLTIQKLACSLQWRVKIILMCECEYKWLLSIHFFESRVCPITQVEYISTPVALVRISDIEHGWMELKTFVENTYMFKVFMHCLIWWRKKNDSQKRKKMNLEKFTRTPALKRKSHLLTGEFAYWISHCYHNQLTLQSILKMRTRYL